jgi:hypothetical protein
VCVIKKKKKLAASDLQIKKKTQQLHIHARKATLAN